MGKNHLIRNNCWEDQLTWLRGHFHENTKVPHRGRFPPPPPVPSPPPLRPERHRELILSCSLKPLLCLNNCCTENKTSRKKSFLVSKPLSSCFYRQFLERGTEKGAKAAASCWAGSCRGWRAPRSGRLRHGETLIYVFR